MRRVPAVSLCAERGFQTGDVLVSSVWKKPRTLASIQSRDIIVRIPPNEVLVPLKTLPADTAKR